MSCPYLEKGKTAYCHAFGDKRLAVDSSVSEDFCFSGEFSECSYLFVPIPVQYRKITGQNNSLAGPFKISGWGFKNSIKGTTIG
jgi:hypothetical protein